MFVKEPAGEVPMIASRVAEDMPNITITEEDVIVEINSINKKNSVVKMKSMLECCTSFSILCPNQ